MACDPLMQRSPTFLAPGTNFLDRLPLTCCRVARSLTGHRPGRHPVESVPLPFEATSRSPCLWQHCLLSASSALEALDQKEAAIVKQNRSVLACFTFLPENLNACQCCSLPFINWLSSGGSVYSAVTVMNNTVLGTEVCRERRF